MNDAGNQAFPAFGCDAVVALVVVEAERGVGVDCVQAVLLQLIGAQPAKGQARGLPARDKE